MYKFLHLDTEHAKNRFNPYVNNGGTVVAIAGEDFVVVGGDSRLSEGYSIVTRS
jgi:20S proteasome subunit beta 6